MLSPLPLLGNSNLCKAWVQMKNKYSKQKDRQLLIRLKSPYVASRKNILGKEVKGIGWKASSTEALPDTQQHSTVTNPSPSSPVAQDLLTWILQRANSVVINRTKEQASNACAWLWHGDLWVSEAQDEAPPRWRRWQKSSCCYTGVRGEWSHSQERS